MKLFGAFLRGELQFSHKLTDQQINLLNCLTGLCFRCAQIRNLCFFTKNTGATWSINKIIPVSITLQQCSLQLISTVLQCALRKKGKCDETFWRIFTRGAHGVVSVLSICFMTEVVLLLAYSNFCCEYQRGTYSYGNSSNLKSIFVSYVSKHQIKVVYLKLYMKGIMMIQNHS